MLLLINKEDDRMRSAIARLGALFYKLIIYSWLRWEPLNSAKWHNFLLITPNPYAYGTSAEEIKHGFLASALQNRELLPIPLYSLNGLLRFRMANSGLYKLKAISKQTRSVKKVELRKNLYKVIFILLINIHFIFTRVAWLTINSLLRSINPKVYQELSLLRARSSFPAVGKTHSYKTILNGYIDREDINDQETGIKPAKMIASFFPTIDLTEKDKIKAIKLTKEIGIKTDKSYICIHIRSAEYFKDHKRRGYRNAQLKDYTSLIKVFLNQNIPIVLFGDSVNNPIEITNPNLYDLRHGRKRSGIVDLYLISRCSFFIGMMSGPLDVAMLFGKDFYCINAYNITHQFSYPGNGFFFTKRPLLKRPEGKKPLSINEWLNLPLEETDLSLESLRSLKLEDLSKLDLENIAQFILKKHTQSNHKDSSLVKGFEECHYEQIYNIRSRVEQRILQTVNVQDRYGNASSKENLMRYKINSTLSKEKVRLYSKVS